MSCAAWSAHVEKAVGALPGVRLVQVNLLAGTMKVEYDESALDDSSIIKAVVDGGYGASVRSKEGAKASAAAPQADPNADLKEMQQRILIWGIWSAYRCPACWPVRKI